MIPIVISRTIIRMGMVLAAAVVFHQFPSARAQEPVPLRSVDDALALAYELNLDVAAANTRRAVAEATIAQAQVPLRHNPTVSISAARRRVDGGRSFDSSASLSLAPLSGFTPSASLDGTWSKESDRTSTDIGLELSQEFELFGQPRARREAARADRDVVNADIQNVEGATLRDVCAAYYAMVVARERARLAREQADELGQLVKLAQRRLDAGDVSRAEVRQFDIQLAALSAEAQLAGAHFEERRYDLADRIGIAPELLEVADAALPPLASDSEAFATFRPADHPAVRAAESRVAATRAEAELVAREAKPNLTATAFWNREENDTHIVGGMLSLPIPVFNRKRGAIDAAEARVTTVEVLAQRERQRVETAFERALAGYHATRGAIQEYVRDGLPNIEENTAAWQNAFVAGEIGAFELRVLRQDLLTARSALFDLQDRHFRWRAELEGLLGATLDSIHDSPEGERP